MPRIKKKKKASASSSAPKSSKQHKKHSSSHTTVLPPLTARPHELDAALGEKAPSAFISPVDIVRGVVPTAPSPDLIKVIAGLVRFGNYPDVACRALGVSLYEYQHWLRKAARHILAGKIDSIYVTFLRAIDAADAQDEVMDMFCISSRVNGWQANAWKRERKSRKRWAQNTAGVGAPQGIEESYPETKRKDLDAPPPAPAFTANVMAILESAGALDGLVASRVEEALSKANKGG